MEYIKEESYPILQGRDLYLPKRAIKSFNSGSFNHLKLSLREYGKSFNEIRCENFDIIATYRPYHFNGEDFGLYLYSEMFSMFVLSIIQRTHMSLRDAHTLALDSILTHGSFHYLIERYATLSESLLNTQRPKIYPTYKRDIYSNVWGTTECIEETLANTFILKAHPLWSKTQREAIEYIIRRQREGYCQAVGLCTDKYEDLYDQLEGQIVKESPRNSPKLSEYINANLPFRMIGLPVYLVNDCTVFEDFEQIIEVLFPQL